MGSKAPQWEQQSLTPEEQSSYEEDVKEIETCGPSAIQTFPAPSIIILEPRNTSAQMESLPTRDSLFQEKINALQMQSLHPTRATLVPTDQTCSHNSLDQSIVSCIACEQAFSRAGWGEGKALFFPKQRACSQAMSCTSFLTDELQQRQGTGKLIA